MNRLMCFLNPCSVALTVIFLVFGTIACGEKKRDEGKEQKTEKAAGVTQPSLSKEVEQVLAKRMELLKGLAEDPATTRALMEANQKNRNTTLDEALRLDGIWRVSENMSEFIKPFLTSEYARRLVDFQDAHDGFPEIFATDERGLIVAATNKTSDYYQADETWWTEAYNQGTGRPHYGEIEYDASARAEAVSLYVPVMDRGKVIGIIKAVCDITAIKLEL